MKKSLLLVSLFMLPLHAGNTFKNIIKHSNLGAPVAAATLGAAYHLTKDADLASTLATSAALASMQIKEDVSRNGGAANVDSTAREALKPWVGHAMAVAGIPATRAALRYLGVPSYLIPDGNVSPRVANFIILTYVGFMKATGQLHEH